MTTPTVTRKICFVPPRFVGDCLFLMPLLRQLKKAWGSRVELGLWLPEIALPLFENCPYVDWVKPATQQSAEFIDTLKQHQVDTVILTRHSAREALLARWAGVKTVIGFQSQRLTKKNYLHWGIGLTHPVNHPVLTAHRHQQDYLWELLEPLSLPFLDKTDRALELWIHPEEQEALQEKLTQNFNITPPSVAPWIVIHWASASKHKDVPLEQLQQGLTLLVENNPTAQLLFTGMPNHSPLYEKFIQEGTFLQASASQPQRSFNLAGRTSLRELAVLLSLSTGLIGLDSAPLHMASAVGVPHVVGVYGAVSPNQWHPPNVEVGRFEAVSLVLPCKPCIAKTCATDACRTDILPSHLSVAINRTFNTN
ncbi:MAG: glycosyltransferase family 9 protein [Vampirovibrio sp.]|nr:glycosyltransferase family 9 protein [Vampirovibrio sp.]